MDVVDKKVPGTTMPVDLEPKRQPNTSDDKRLTPRTIISVPPSTGPILGSTEATLTGET